MSSSFCLLCILLGLIWISAAFRRGSDMPTLPPAEEANLGDYPFVVSVQNSYDEMDFSHECAGVILTEKHILTVADCVDMSRPSRIMAGGLALEDSEDKSQEFRKISKITEMPKEDDVDEENLIRKLAILELETPLEFGPEIGPIPIPNDSESFPVFGEEGNCVTVGWHSWWGVLRWSNTTAISDEECLMRDQKSEDRFYAAHHLKQPEAELCTTDKEEKPFRVLCLNIGSPVICEDQDGLKKVFGIETHSNLAGCGGLRLRGDIADHGPILYIFSEVSHFLDWIRENSSVE
ncbi:unnamed protein product [Cyprideis torosa]|uniref:Uncharacterized protein n=1 Tax=Cyprideis torosa TaxID=163714 RepID=A0A7R8WD90_9CRUS|nr:unnamed protein product [Cyprideis torosa]CAG0888732.1 unnamed protein product [Cyprideis torosa]